MQIRYHLVKDMPASGNWADDSKWTMMTDVNGVRVGHLTLTREELLDRLIKAHGQPGMGIANGKLSICGIWPGRDVTYIVTVKEEEKKGD